MKTIAAAVLLSALLGGCVVVPWGYGHPRGYYRGDGYYRSDRYYGGDRYYRDGYRDYGYRDR
jgi:hypothetical protein